MAAHALDWWATTEDLPMPDDRVTHTAAGDITAHHIRCTGGG